jgi:hypothetical protein
MKPPKQYARLLDDRQHSYEPASCLASYTIRRAQPKRFLANRYGCRKMISRPLWMTAHIGVPLWRTRGSGLYFHGGASTCSESIDQPQADLVLVEATVHR